MKIAFISTSRWPSELADSRLMVKMAENLSKLGHKITFIIPQRSQTNQSLINRSPWKYYDIKPNSFKLKKLFCLDWLPLYSFGLWQPLLTFSFFLSCLIFLLRNRPNIIYFYQKEFTLLKLFFPRTKLVLEFHDQPTDFYQKNLFRFTKNQVDLWITPTKSLARLLTDSRINKNKVAISPAGVDIEKFNKLTKLQARKKLNLPIKFKIIGYTGRLEGKEGSRGVGDILKAMSILVNKNKNLLFVSVGGPKKSIEKYQLQASRLKVSKFCLFFDHVDHSQIPVYLASFDTCLLPFPNKPHYASHMSPMKMLEYIAAKRPIVTTDLPSIREVLNEFSALFVKPNNPASLVQGIRQALNQKTSSKLTKKAYTIVQSLTWKHRAKKILFNFSNL